jgi:hypothetical protein
MVLSLWLSSNSAEFRPCYVDFKQRRNQCRFSENILRAGKRWQSRQGVCRLFSPEYDLCLTFIMVTERQKRRKITVLPACAGSGAHWRYRWNLEVFFPASAPGLLAVVKQSTLVM